MFNIYEEDKKSLNTKTISPENQRQINDFIILGQFSTDMIIRGEIIDMTMISLQDQLIIKLKTMNVEIVNGVLKMDLQIVSKLIYFEAFWK